MFDSLNVDSHAAEYGEQSENGSLTPEKVISSFLSDFEELRQDRSSRIARRSLVSGLAFAVRQSTGEEGEKIIADLFEGLYQKYGEEVKKAGWWEGETVGLNLVGFLFREVVETFPLP